MVPPVLVDGREAVEQVRARHSHAVEPDAPVVDAVEPRLEPTGLDAHAGLDAALCVADRHELGVYAVVFVRDDEAGEHSREQAVLGRIADIVLGRTVVRRVHHELVGDRVVGCRGLHVAHVRAVPGLGHGVAARELEPCYRPQIRLVVARRPQL